MKRLISILLLIGGTTGLVYGAYLIHPAIGLILTSGLFVLLGIMLFED